MLSILMLILRSLQTLAQAQFQPKMHDINEVVRYQFRVLPSDIDIYRHMNHAKYLNYLEAARWGVQVRCRFLPLALKMGWICPISRVDIEYYRPLSLLQKFEIATQFIHFEEKWLYLLQRIYSEEKEIARALIKGTIRKGRLNIPPEEYLVPLGYQASDASIPKDVTKWVQRRLLSRKQVLGQESMQT